MLADVIFADVMLVNISHQFDLSCWCFLGIPACQLAVSLICRPSSKGGIHMMMQCASDGKIIMESTLIAHELMLRLPFPLGDCASAD